MIQIPLEIGDIILTGRFKNKKVKVREIGTDDFGNPTVNGRSILKIRIPKLYQTQENTMKSNDKKSINERLHQHDTEVKIKNKDGKWWICTETDQGEEYLNSVGFDTKEAAEHSALTKGYTFGKVESYLSEPLKATKSEPTKFEKPEEIKLSKEKEIKLESILRRIIKEEISKGKVLREIYTKDDLKFVDGKAIIKKGNKVVAKIYDRPVYYKANNIKSTFSPKYPVSLDVNGTTRECESIEDALSALNKLLFENKKLIKEADFSNNEDLSKEIEEYADLADQIDRLNAQIKLLEKRYKELDSKFINMLDKLEEELGNSKETFIRAKNILITIKKRGGDRTSFKYKEAFEWLYERVNPQMKKLIDETLEANKTISQVKSSLSVQRESKLSESWIGDVFNKVKSFFANNILKLRKTNQSANTELDKLESLVNNSK